MVKVQIPVDTPVDEDDADDNQVGIMSDSEESDVDDDIGDPDWEEVKNKDGADDDDFSFKPGKVSLNLPENQVSIKISNRPRRGKRRDKSERLSGDEDEEEESDDEYLAKKRKKLDLNEIVRRRINRVKITEQLMRHKLSLLLYLARGLRLVKIINCNVVKGLSLSVVENSFKTKLSKKKLKSERKILEAFMEQFENTFNITSDEDKRSKHMQQAFMLNLLDCFANLEATSLIELVVLFVSCLKALHPNTHVRIVNVLRPITLRADIIPKPASSTAENGNGTAEAKKESPPPEGIVEKLDYWVEIYLSDEKRWCCVDLCNSKLDEPTVLVELSRPFSYLVSFDVDRYCVKPAEKNYCENWYTIGFRRHRCEDKWWDSVMAALGPSKKSDKDHADETKTDEVLSKQDLPTSDNGFRNHPLYVLQKHLLKFQAIYPPDVPPLNEFKGQPVYPRDCVQTVRSRETWLREARTVKQGESAYKIVTARPKRDKYTGNWIRDLPLELFGEWQTIEYDPPTAVDGKVPRNAYGNVDMYKECMLPKGCVWLKLPGLIRIANKLQIDAAAAVTGFDCNSGSYGFHPIVEGTIVCEEFADTLKMAWEEEQRNIAQREEEKRSKKIWENWRRLIKAAMIREKLRLKYKNS